jgi:hypothetical protein
MPTLSSVNIAPKPEPKKEAATLRPELQEREKRKTYRDVEDFKFMLRLRLRKNEPRVIVRVFETDGPNPGCQYLTPVVLLGGATGYQIFPREFLKVESPEGGWPTDPEDEKAKLAVMQLLAAEPGDPGVPDEFFKSYSNMQLAFVKDNARAVKSLIWQRYES